MTYVVNPTSGVKLPCCWDDCWKPGHEEHKAVVSTDGRQLHYVFCSEKHRSYYANSHRSYGNAGVR